QGHDDLASRLVEAGLERRRLAVVANQIKGLEPAARGGKFGQDRCRIVLGAIVYTNQLEAATCARQGATYTLYEVRQIRFLVVYRDDDGNLRMLGGHRWRRNRLRPGEKWTDSIILASRGCHARARTSRRMPPSMPPRSRAGTRVLVGSRSGNPLAAPPRSRPEPWR